MKAASVRLSRRHTRQGAPKSDERPSAGKCGLDGWQSFCPRLNVREALFLEGNLIRELLQGHGTPLQ